jgi:hypothetical protein
MQEDQSNKRVINWQAQLFHAVEMKSRSQAERLLSRKRAAPDCRDEKGGTPLMKASEAGDTSMVGLLLRHRADPNAVDSDGDTALVKAAFGGHSGVVKLLMSHGADVDIRNNENMTALEIAQELVTAFREGDCGRWFVAEAFLSCDNFRQGISSRCDSSRDVAGVLGDRSKTEEV